MLFNFQTKKVLNTKNIRNLKYYPFNTWILCTENLVLNASFKNFGCTKINNLLICLEKNDKYVFKIPYTQHKFLALNMHISSFSKKPDAKIYIFKPCFFFDLSMETNFVNHNFVLKKTLVSSYPSNILKLCLTFLWTTFVLVSL